MALFVDHASAKSKVVPQRTAMATSSGCGDHGQVEQAIAERLSVYNVDYGPETLTFRRGSSWDGTADQAHDMR